MSMGRRNGLGDVYGTPNGYLPMVGPMPAQAPYFPPAAQPAPASRKMLSWEAFGLAERLLYLDLITRPSVAPTRNEPAFSGGTIGSSTEKLAFFTNNTDMPVGLRAVGDSLASTVRCNFYRDSVSDDSFIDYVSNVGTVRNETNQMIVLPGQVIYVANVTSGITMDSGDTLRKLIVDPTQLLQDDVWKGLAGR